MRRKWLRRLTYVSCVTMTTLIAPVIAQTDAHPPAAPMPATTARIDGVPVLDWMTSGQTTFCGALSAALAVTDRPRDYVTLMGDTGLAFRTRWWLGADGKGWSMSSPVGEMGPWTDVAAKAIGWTIRWEPEIHGGDVDMSRHKADVVRNIDAKLPVLIYGKTLDLGVVYGYDAGGDILLVRDYFEGARETKVPIVRTKGLLAFLDKKTDAPTRHEAVVAGLKMADADWAREPAPADMPPAGKGSYLFDASAYDAWIKNLRDADALTDDQRKTLFNANWWTMCVLVDARQAAAKYLRQSASELDGPAGEELTAAAGIYETLIGPVAGEIFGQKTAFLGPWSGKSITDWTKDVRQREIETLTKFRDADTEVMGHVRSAIE